MAVSTSHAIFLGNVADADSNEGSLALESPGTYLGTFGSAGAPLSDQIFDLTYNDANSNGSMETDNVSGSETVSYDVGSGPVTSAVDSLVVVNITVTYSDGSSQSFSNAVMFQDASGNLFLTNSNFAGTDLNGPNNLPIESVNVTSISGSGYTGLFQNALQDFVCFASGTMIAVPEGERTIETLKTGDLVITRDHGAQPIRWIGERTVRTTPELAPVVIEAGAMGAGTPRRTLNVSQQHRMLIRSRIVRRMLGVDETLVPAKRLIGMDGIRINDTMPQITYLHLLFDDHQVIFANGAAAESLLPGPQALKSMGAALRGEILSIFPEYADLDAARASARIVPRGKQQRKLIERHRKNARPLLEDAM